MGTNKQQIQWQVFSRDTSSKATVSNDADLSKPETPIYRYLAWNRARELCSSNALRLASPRTWTDPYEAWWCKLLFKDGTRLGGACAFASCWTTCYGDEPYWRLYDHGGTESVVRIRTSVGRMLTVLSQAVDTTPAKAFIGRVRYLRTSSLVSAAKDFQAGGEKGVAAVAARMLHMKRSPFRFEREVRIVWIDRHADADARFVGLDASQVLEQVMIGPSVQTATARSIKGELMALGIPAKRVRQSVLYRAPA
jgi:hypothetical protein